MENETAEVAAEVLQKKQKKKRGKLAEVYRQHQKGLSPKEISEKWKLNERIVRAYIWRMKNPEKYKALVQRYFERKRQKQENETIKTIVKNNHKTGARAGKVLSNQPHCPRSRTPLCDHVHSFYYLYTYLYSYSYTYIRTHTHTE